MKHNLLEICYLVGSVTFIIGLKMMGNAKTARKGNLIGAGGMTLAILGTIFLHEGPVPMQIFGMIFGAIALGTIIGWMTAKKVQMTKMPELVSMFNGMGGACAALISLIEFNNYMTTPDHVASVGTMIAIIAGLIIGTVSFSGSIIAYLKLNGTMDKPIRLPKYNILNTIVMIAVFAFGGYIVATGGSMMLVYLLFAAAIVYGILFTIPIGATSELTPFGSMIMASEKDPSGLATTAGTDRAQTAFGAGLQYLTVFASTGPFSVLSGVEGSFTNWGTPKGFTGKYSEIAFGLNAPLVLNIAAA